ncbi:MAG: metalloregulator ArsR/SmtB family transcription factor [Chthoniobacteraceae bacterium]
MNSPETPAPAPFIALGDILTAISDRTRWRILDELLKGEPLPVMELARRLGAPGTNISKHMNVLRTFGLVTRGFGSLYRIPAPFLVPGQRALDFGAVLLRLDRLDGE